MNALSLNSANCWKHRESCATSSVSQTLSRVVTMSRENVTGAVNQQERLDAYIAGYVDGEGSFHVAVQRNPTTKARWQLVPEFHVSQCPERRQVLDLMAQRLGCGRIRENHRGSTDTTLVLVVRRREDLLLRVIPFFEMQPLLSSKHQEFVTFAHIVRAMDRGEHLRPAGFTRLFELAVAMNGGGRYRRIHRSGVQNPQRPYAEHRLAGGEDMVRSARRRAEPGRTRNDLALGHEGGRGNNNVGPYPMQP